MRGGAVFNDIGTPEKAFKTQDTRSKMDSRFSRVSLNSFSKKKLERFACRAFGVPLNWQNEDRQQTPVCIGIPIITEYEKYSANFGGFSSLWGRTNVPRHSLRSPVTTNTFVT